MDASPALRQRPTAHAADRSAVLPATKPRLLFFQWDHRPNASLSSYLVTQTSEHARCLAEYFDVTVIAEDCDYAEACDRHRPDLVLVESGYQTTVSRRPTVRNVRANPGVPKLGFHNADSWSDCRSGFLSDMEHWGIDTYFSICTTTAEYMPSVADRTFVWPNFIDPAVYRDYGLEKTVPVMLCGKAHGTYPWRQAVFPVVAELFPTLNCPQFAHQSGLGGRSLTGTAYARALNASRISLTCGTMAREVVRKHFEIPAVATCMIAEKAAVLEEAGFVHMENCVFARPDEVVEIIDALLADPETLARIARSGHDLVHARHTLSQRPQIAQWLQLHATLAPGETIVQRGPFGDLVAARDTAPARSWKSSESADRALLRQAADRLADGDIRTARDLYARCLEFAHYLPEARLGLARCALAEGDPGTAADLLARLVEGTTVDYGAKDPDPAEWALLILSVVARGRLDEAVDLCAWYPDLASVELDRVRQAVFLLAGRTPPPAATTPDRPSIHALPELSDAEWTAWVATTLDAAGQGLLAARIRGDGAGAVPPTRVRGRERMLRLLGGAFGALGLTALRPNVPATPDFAYLRHVKLALARAATRHPLGARLREMRRRRRARSEMAEIRTRLRSVGSS